MHRRWLSSVFTFVLLMHTAAIGLAATELRWQDVAADLMSPACPGRTLLNCTSDYAEQWRELIRQKIAQGETRDEIMQYFVSMRGEEVLAAPPKRGFALTAWLLPIFVVVNGAGLILVLTYRWTRSRPSQDSDQVLAAPPTTAAEDADAPYRRRLQRELEDFSDN